MEQLPAHHINKTKQNKTCDVTVENEWVLETLTYTQAGPNSSGNASRGLGFALYQPFFKAQHRLRLCFKLCQSILHILGFAVENLQELR